MQQAQQRFQAEANSLVVWDADALNLLSLHPNLQAAIQKQHIITPHPTEAARLLQVSTAEIQANRHAAVAQLCECYACISVLKGHHSLVKIPNQTVYENQTGNPGLATAGSGDILSGFMTSLLAQGINPAMAASAAVWIHGAAAEILALQDVGPIGMVATELVNAARLLRNQLTLAIDF